jgi:hypothetical protein
VGHLRLSPVPLLFRRAAPLLLFRAAPRRAAPVPLFRAAPRRFSSFRAAPLLLRVRCFFGLRRLRAVSHCFSPFVLVGVQNGARLGLLVLSSGVATAVRPVVAVLGCSS